MNFVMLPSIISAKFHLYKAYRQYLLIKATMLVFCTKCSETQVATSSLINTNSLSCCLRQANLQIYQAVCNVQTAVQLSQWTCLRRNICSQVLIGKQMAACKQIRVDHVLQWLTIVTQVYAAFDVICFITLNFCLSTVVLSAAKYQQWKTKASVSAQKSFIDQALLKPQSNLASSIVQLTTAIQNR